MLAMSTLTSRSPGRYVRISATMARVTRSRRRAAAKAADRSAAGSASEGRPTPRGRRQAVDLVVGVEREPRVLVERRHPAEVARLGRLVDVLEEPLEPAEPGLRPRRTGQHADHRPAQHAARAVGDTLEQLGQRQRPVSVVPAEELVAGVAGQRDRHRAPGLACDVPRRQGRAVGERLVEVPGQLGQRLPRLRLDDERLMLGAQVLRGQLGVARLVVLRVGEADRERLHRPARGPLHQPHDDRRVDPAREERAQRHVRDHLLAHGVAEGLGQLVDVLVHRSARARGSSRATSSARSPECRRARPR